MVQLSQLETCGSQSGVRLGQTPQHCWLVTTPIHPRTWEKSAIPYRLFQNLFRGREIEAGDGTGAATVGQEGS